MIAAEREMDSIKNYYADVANMVVPYFTASGDEYTYNDYLEEFGYDGELYVCYEEFCDIEYHDKEYMCSLLSDAGLISLYYADINTDDEI
jgi:hypothetical protein